MKRKAGFLAADEEHGLADARAHRIDRDERTADILAVGANRLHEQQLDAVEVGILAGGDDVADDAGHLHDVWLR